MKIETITVDQFIAGKNKKTRVKRSVSPDCRAIDAAKSGDVLQFVYGDKKDFDTAVIRMSRKLHREAQATFEYFSRVAELSIYVRKL